MAEHRLKSQMLGDVLREVAVLWMALYPLEAYLIRKFDWSECGFAILVAGAFMYLGMILEGTEGF